MELSLAKLISTLIKKPDLVAQSGGDVELILAHGGVTPTGENRAALQAVLKFLGREPSSSVMNEPVPGWDGEGLIIPIAVSR